MFLVQMLLPLFDNAGAAFPPETFRHVQDELTQAWGGVTAYTRSPAQGRWKEQGDRVAHDEVLIFEVMVESLDRAWWSRYRSELERRFAQQAMVMRAMAVEVL